MHPPLSCAAALPARGSGPRGPGGAPEARPAESPFCHGRQGNGPREAEAPPRSPAPSGRGEGLREPHAAPGNVGVNSTGL